MALTLLQVKRRCDLLHCGDIVPSIHKGVFRINLLFPLPVTELDHSEGLKLQILHKRKGLEDDKPGMCSSLTQPVPRLEMGVGRLFLPSSLTSLTPSLHSKLPPASEPLRRPAQCDLHSLIWMFHCGLHLSFLYTISQTPQL